MVAAAVLCHRLTRVVPQGLPPIAVQLEVSAWVGREAESVGTVRRIRLSVSHVLINPPTSWP